MLTSGGVTLSASRTGQREAASELLLLLLLLLVLLVGWVGLGCSALLCGLVSGELCPHKTCAHACHDGVACRMARFRS